MIPFFLWRLVTFVSWFTMIVPRSTQAFSVVCRQQRPSTAAVVATVVQLLQPRPLVHPLQQSQQHRALSIDERRLRKIVPLHLSPFSSALFSSSSSSSRSSEQSESLKAKELEFVTLQANVSQSLVDNNNNNNNKSNKNDEDPEQAFLKHIAETYDNLAEFFAEKLTIPEPIVRVYEIMAEKIIHNLIEERCQQSKSNKSNNNNNDNKKNADGGEHDANVPFLLLDVAAGTGALWPFLLEQATRRGVRLDIHAIDLSPGMVERGQVHAQTLLSQYPQHTISVTVANVVEYTTNDSTTFYDAIVCNACWGNFYNPAAVLHHLSGLLRSQNSNAAGSFGTLFVTHPLGAGFVQDLHESDPRVVPHVMPDTWNPLLIGVPLYIQEFQQSLPPPMEEGGNNSTSLPFYFAALKRRRYSLLQSLWRFRGPVAKGYGRGGKKLGFPTANLVASQFFQDALDHVDSGVYIGWARIEPDEMVHKAVVNVGYSPTFEGQENKEKIIEAHLMPDTPLLQDFYDQTMRLQLLAYLRPEQKFASFPALIAQISADVVDSKTALHSDPILAQACRDAFFTTTPSSWMGSTSSADGSSSYEQQDMKDYLELD